MDEILIKSVFKREPLWNLANELHNNAVVLKKLWEEVGVEVEKDVKTVKARWKNLRAYFFKECGKIDKPKSGDSADKICKSTWQYYYSQTSQRKKIRMNRTENNDQLLEIEKKKLEILQRESIKKKSDDLLFFESILPYMENIPLRRKLKLRSKIQELILTEIEAAENNIQQSVRATHIPVPNVNTQQSVEYELHIQDSSEQNLIHNIPMQIENDSTLISYINNYK